MIPIPFSVVPAGRCLAISFGGLDRGIGHQKVGDHIGRLVYTLTAMISPTVLVTAWHL